MWLPGKRYQCSDVCRSAQISCEGLRGGMNRAVDGIDESWLARVGDSAEYRWEKPVKLQNTRLVFDSFLNRPEKNIIANIHKLVVLDFTLNWRNNSQQGFKEC